MKRNVFAFNNTKCLFSALLCFCILVIPLKSCTQIINNISSENTPFISLDEKNDSLNIQKLKDEVLKVFNEKARSSSLSCPHNNIQDENKNWSECKEDVDFKWQETFVNFDEMLHKSKWDVKQTLLKKKQTINEKNIIGKKIENHRNTLTFINSYIKDLKDFKTDILEKEVSVKLSTIPQSVVIIGRIHDDVNGVTETDSLRSLLNFYMMDQANRSIFGINNKKSTIDNDEEYTSSNINSEGGNAKIIEKYYGNITVPMPNNDTLIWIVDIIRYNVLPGNLKEGENEIKSKFSDNKYYDLFIIDPYDNKLKDNKGRIISVDSIFYSKSEYKDALDYLTSASNSATKTNTKYNNKKKLLIKENIQKIKINTNLDKFQDSLKVVNIAEISLLERKHDSCQSVYDSLDLRIKELDNVLAKTALKYKNHYENRYEYTNRIKTWQSGQEYKLTDKTVVSLKEICPDLASEAYDEINKEIFNRISKIRIVKEVKDDQENSFMGRTDISYYSKIVGFKVITLNTFKKNDNKKYIALNLAFQIKLIINSDLEFPQNNNPNELILIAKDYNNNTTQWQFSESNRENTIIDYKMYNEKVGCRLPDKKEVKNLFEAIKNYNLSNPDNSKFKDFRKFLKYPIPCMDSKDGNKLYYQFSDLEEFDFKQIKHSDDKICTILLIKN